MANRSTSTTSGANLPRNIRLDGGEADGSSRSRNGEPTDRGGGGSPFPAHPFRIICAARLIGEIAENAYLRVSCETTRNPSMGSRVFATTPRKQPACAYGGKVGAIDLGEWRTAAMGCKPESLPRWHWSAWGRSTHIGKPRRGYRGWGGFIHKIIIIYVKDIKSYVKNIFLLAL